MESKSKKFLDAKTLKSKALIWQIAANQSEKPGTGYYNGNVSRIEGHPGRDRDIKEAYDISFIEEVIPKIINRKKDGKVKILDVGGGVWDFANQIRQKFGDKVEVFTTGISKQAAKRFKVNRLRKLDRNSDSGYILKIPLNLHANDLKWRSVLELSDFPEFDLIIDTCGENLYSYFDNEDRKGTMLNYITVLAKKLKPQGQAYISPAISIRFAELNSSISFKDLEAELGISIDLTEPSHCKIIKL